LEIMKSNLLLGAAIICLLTIVIMSSNSPQRINGIDSLIGQWIGLYKNSNIMLEVKENNTCSLEFRDILSNDSEIFNGDCSLDDSKRPYTFIMTNILETTTSLYSIMLPIDDNVIHISGFSNKWRLRPLVLTPKNTMILQKIIN